MSRLLDLLLPLEFTPSIPGLEVTEPLTELQKNLAALEFTAACAAFDDCGDFAMAHPEVVR